MHIRYLLLVISVFIGQSHSFQDEKEESLLIRNLINDGLRRSFDELYEEPGKPEFLVQDEQDDESKARSKNAPKNEQKNESKNDLKNEQKNEPKNEQENEPEDEPKTDPKTEPKIEQKEQVDIKNSNETVQPLDAEQSTKQNQTGDLRAANVNTESIKKQFEKHHLLDQKQFGELCSDKVLDKSLVQTVHRSGKNFVLTLDDLKLAFKVEIDEANKFYPKLTKLPYRCTSYCEKTANKTAQQMTINRFKYNSYLIEFLNLNDHQFVKFYLENNKFLESENQSEHLVEVLTFTIETDGCTSPVTNPQLRDNYVDNLVTKDLIKIFCNEQLRGHFKDNNQFLIQEKNGPDDSMFKVRHVLFFTYPVVSAYNLTNDLKKDTNLQKSNLANSIQGIKNAVQMKLDENDDRELFLTFSDKQVYMLQKQETQLVERPPVYSLQNYFSCPEPLCLDPYFDDVFIVKSCDFDLLFDFLPRASKLLVAFRGNYFYLLNKDNVNAPKVEQAIPIDYLFKDVLNRPDIDFKYINAAEYVKKSEVIILFKDDKYLLIDPLNKIVNGPFDISETFKYAKSSPGKLREKRI